MSPEAHQIPLSPEEQMLEQQRVEAFTKLRDATQYNGMTLTPDQFQAMQDLVEGYIHTYNIEPATMKTPGVRGKTGWVKDLATGGKGKIWSLQYDPEGKYMKLGVNTLEPDQVQVILAAGTQSASTQVHQVLQSPQTSVRHSPLVSAEMKVLEGESIKFFGANGRVQRLMVDDILAQKGLTLAKLFNYAKAAAEPDIAIRFLERYFDEVDDFGVPEFPEDQLQELNHLVASMNGKRTQVPDYCATRLAKFHIHKSADEIVESAILLFRKGSQACLRITLLEALGQKVKKGEVVAPEKIRALWKEGREETFVFLKYLTKQQREEVTR